MAITIHDTDVAGATSTTAASLSLPSTEGRQQLVALGGRTEATAPSISGTGWTLRALIETEIANISARRQIAVWTRTVPAAASGTITANWSASTSKAAVGYEFDSDSGDSWTVTVGGDTDNGTSDTTGLASASLAPADVEAIIIACFTARNSSVVIDGNLAYSNSFTAGPAGNSAGTPTANHCATFAAHFINSDLTARSTAASWSPSPGTLATSIILAISVDEGGGQTLDGGAAIVVVVAGTDDPLVGSPVVLDGGSAAVEITWGTVDPLTGAPAALNGGAATVGLNAGTNTPLEAAASLLDGGSPTIEVTWASADPFTGSPALLDGGSATIEIAAGTDTPLAAGQTLDGGAAAVEITWGAADPLSGSPAVLDGGSATIEVDAGVGIPLTSGVVLDGGSATVELTWALTDPLVGTPAGLDGGAALILINAGTLLVFSQGDVVVTEPLTVRDLTPARTVTDTTEARTIEEVFGQ